MNTNTEDGRTAAPWQEAPATPLESKMADAIVELYDRCNVQGETIASLHRRMALTEASLAVVTKCFEAVHARLLQLEPHPERN